MKDNTKVSLTKCLQNVTLLKNLDKMFMQKYFKKLLKIL